MRAAAAFLMVMALAPGDGLAAATASRSPARGPACPVTGTRAVTLDRIIDGSTFTTSEGVEVRLTGVLAPGAGGETLTSSQTREARSALGRALAKAPVMLAGDDGTPDRYGRILTQVFAGGVWVQEAMLRAGELRAAPDRVSAPCAARLLAAEGEARARRLGRWRDGLFALSAPDQLEGRVGTFQIIEGDVVTATLLRGRGFINFGADYRTDFTVTIAPTDMAPFRQARFDVRTLKGKRVRVRGWVELYNGPEMQIASPSAIELVN